MKNTQPSRGSRRAEADPKARSGGGKKSLMERIAEDGRFERAKLAGPPRLATAAPEPAASEAADVVTLPRADYDALIERIEDLEAGRAFERSRDEERVPADMVKRLIAGDNPVRVWRKHRGLKLHELAARIDKSGGYLSEIEHGKKPGSVAVLTAIAAVLEVDIEDLVWAPHE